ncbi:protein O-mannosyl-transferase TMTC4-like [Branchiostoma floridae]|uniref:dolichyl-phosphate-mannose--protein mannosyltransferase n=1 Tax=Branchiostoma floridae TaxID=7739 RepID=A0A9J7N8D0_BRAFL|nr:protein O-mannosyl-transferase TMTC4-like [Branchiostoma floridae]
MTTYRHHKAANGISGHHQPANRKTSSSSDEYSHKKEKREAPEWDRFLPVPKLSIERASVTVCLLALLCFWRSWDGEFLFDDSEAIVNNKDLLAETPVWELFQHDFWGKNLASKTSHKSYRPLTVLTFRLNHWFAGGLSQPWSFHAVNLLLHAAICVQLLHVFSVIFGGVRRDVSGERVFAAPRASFLAATLFAVHPVHTESVAGVVGRAELLCALFFFSAFLCYVRSCHEGTQDPQCCPESFSVRWLAASVVLCAASVLCKGQGITAIGVCSAYDILILCQLDPKVFLSKLLAAEKSLQFVKKQGLPVWVRSLLLRQLFLVATGAAIMTARWWVMGSTPPAFQPVDNPAAFSKDLSTRVLTHNYIYAINAWLLFFPWWLCFDWSMGCVPLLHSVGDPRVLAPVALWLGLLGLLTYCVVGLADNTKRVFTLGLAVLIVPFLPACNLFFTVGFVVAERVLYLPSAGFVLMVVAGLNVIQAFLVLVVFLNIIRCTVRSAEWGTEEALFTSGLRVCPLNAKVHYNIGKIRGDQGRTDVAIAAYRHALRLNPEYDQTMNNLANILKDRGELGEAELLLERAVQIRPEFAAAWMNLGIVQAQLKKPQSAEHSYWTAITHRRKYPDCYYNLGNLYLELKQHGDALNAWRNATLLKPQHTLAWTNMIVLLDNLGDLSKAEVVGKEAVKVLPNDPSIQFTLANVLGKASKYQVRRSAAMSSWSRDVSSMACRRPLLFAVTGDVRIHSWSSLPRRNKCLRDGRLVLVIFIARLLIDTDGVLYHRWGKYPEAERCYKRSIELDPTASTTQENLVKLQRTMNKNSSREHGHGKGRR